MVSRPICVHCTRAARTVETPRVKARVVGAVVYRDPVTQELSAVWRCHGAVEAKPLSSYATPDVWTEKMIAELEVFRGE